MSEILKSLNEEQSAAVKCTSGPMLIVAGAGSGKTRVLTSRIAYLIEQGVLPERILALTFTKKAAAEMKERIALMVGERQARRLWMGTFHSVFIRFLRDWADAIGFPKTFTIYDTTDSVSAVKACIKQLELDDKMYKPKEVLARISKAKNDLVTPTPYMNGAGGYRDSDNKHKKPEIYRIYSLYCQTCKQNGVMDFDDILLYMNVLFKVSPDALADIAGRFDHILVDEYQDTNLAQYFILRKLADGHKNLCVVGDDSQSIYGFRGAQIQNILNFRKDFPGARTFRLERNYRSTRTIVNAANTLIAHNEGRIPKECVSMGEEGEKIQIKKAFRGDKEAEMIASRILDLLREYRCEYSDMAVLYRTNSQSDIIEEFLRKRNIPYKVFGMSFYDRAEVKDVLAYLKLVVNPSDDESLKRVVNKPTRGIGDTSLSAWKEAANNSHKSLYTTALEENLEEYGLKSAAVGKIRTFCSMIKQYADQVSVAPAIDIANGILQDSGLYLYYKSDTSIEGQAKFECVREVIDNIAYKQQVVIEEAEEANEQPVLHLIDYLEDVALLSNIDNDEDEQLSNKVSLMTIHTAKGLEFEHVIVAGMEENIFPSGGWMLTPQDLEEERRLFYVAMTRAKTTLTLFYATERFRNGKTEYNSPSRFLRELAPQYVDKPLVREDFERSTSSEEDNFGTRGFSWRKPGDAFSAARYRSEASKNASPSTARPVTSARPVVSAKPVVDNRPPIVDPNFVPEPMSSFKVGDRIEHNRFGAGVVLEITGQVPDLKAKINFDQYGEKLLLLKFAKLRHKG